MGELNDTGVSAGERGPFAECFEGDAWELPADFKVIDVAEEEFEKRLREAGWDEEDIDWLKLGFREALVNAVGHGVLGLQDPRQIHDMASERIKQPLSEKKVRVAISFDKDPETQGARGVKVVIQDGGSGFDWRGFLKKREESRSEEGVLQENGRGIFLMSEFFEVSWNEEGNEVTLLREKGNAKEKVEQT